MKRTGVRGVFFGVLLAVFLWAVVVPGLAFAAPSGPDVYEPDDSPAAAQVITVDGVKQEHSLYPAYDHDWQKFDAVAGHRYLIQTGPGSPEPTQNQDFYLRLYAADGVTQLAADDDGGPYNYSVIHYTAAVSGTLYIENHSYAYDADTGYYAIRVIDTTTSGATIRGTARVGTAPAAGVLVTVKTSGDPWLTALEDGYSTEDFTTTGADGTYHIGVGEGTQIVRFGGEAYEPQWYSLASTEGEATSFVLAANGERTGVDASLVIIPPIPRVAQLCSLVSVSTTGALGDNSSYDPAVSSNGRFVAFTSYAANFWTPPFTGEHPSQVYLRDRLTGVTSLESLSSAGEVAGQSCYSAGVSDDGRFVVFQSDSTNLVPGIQDSTGRIYLRDRVTRETVCVSVRADGQPTSGDSDEPVISSNGRYVAYYSSDRNLVTGDTNGSKDVFVWDRTTGTTVRASLSSTGVEGARGSRSPSISGDGRYVAFITGNAWAEGDIDSGVESTGDEVDVYVKDMVTGGVVRASVPATPGAVADSWGPAISADGRHVAFGSDAENLVLDDTNRYSDVFLRDLDTNVTTCISRSISGEQANGDSWSPSVNADGSIVVFTSSAGNLVPNDSSGAAPVPAVRAAVERAGSDDVFVRDLGRGAFGMVSLSARGRPGDDDSGDATGISADGKTIVFDSDASNLVANDVNGDSDVLVAAYPLAPPVSPAPPVTLGRPWSPYRVRLGRSFSGWGTMRPKYASGRKGVVSIQCYRLVNGSWVYVKSVSTKTYNMRGWKYTKYAARMSFNKRGTWKMVATRLVGGQLVTSPTRVLHVR